MKKRAKQHAPCQTKYAEHGHQQHNAQDPSQPIERGRYRRKREALMGVEDCHDQPTYAEDHHCDNLNPQQSNGDCDLYRVVISWNQDVRNDPRGGKPDQPGHQSESQHN